MAIPSDLQRKHAITIDAAEVGVGGVLGFPVAIQRVHLADEVVDPSGANAARADGGDIRFSADTAGLNQLAIDVISFGLDSVTGAGDAAVVIRINVASLSDLADTTIYVWYKGTTTTTQPAAASTYGRHNAYPASLLAYWPMGAGADRTSNAIDLTAEGTLVVGGVAGELGVATDYNGTSHYADTTDAAIIALPQTYDFTVLSWINPDVLSLAADAAWSFEGTDDLLLYPNDNVGGVAGVRVWWRDLVGDVINEDAVSVIGSWHQYAFTSRASNDHEGYRDAVSVGVGANTGSAGLFSSFRLGSWTTTAQNFDGQIGGTQVYQSARSVAWLTTDKNNIKTPATFATAGTPQSASANPTPPHLLIQGSL